MANLFVIYIPIEDVSDEANNNVPSAVGKAPPAAEPVAVMPRVSSSNRFRNVASSSDLARLSGSKQPQDAQKSQPLPALGTYDDAENQSESKPLLDSDENRSSSNNMPKSASSNILMNQLVDSVGGSGNGDGTLNKNSFRDVPGSRFKISAAVNIDDSKGMAVTEQARTNRRTSLVPEAVLTTTAEEEITKEEITLKEVGWLSIMIILCIITILKIKT